METGSKRRRFDKQFKLDAVRLVTEGGKKASEVARDLGVNPNTISNWKREFGNHGGDAFPGNGRLMPADEELRRLHRELPHCGKRIRFQKGDRILHEAREVRYRFMEDHRSQFRVMTMCRVLHLTRSSYNYWRKLLFHFVHSYSTAPDREMSIVKTGA